MNAHREKVGRLINEYLAGVLLLQVATAVDGVPWVCTVCFASDKDMHLYWLSRHDARHSRDIERNPVVAGAVVGPFAIGDESRGLQISGAAAEVSDAAEVAQGLSAMKERYGISDERCGQLRREILGQSGDYGLYRLRPEQIVLLDKVNFPDEPRQVYALRSPSRAHR